MADTPTTSAFTPTSSRAQSRRSSISSQISNLTLTPTATPRCAPHESFPKEQTPPKYREFHILEFQYEGIEWPRLTATTHSKYQVRDDGISMSTKIICEALYTLSDTPQLKEIRDLLFKESVVVGQELMITYCSLQKEIRLPALKYITYNTYYDSATPCSTTQRLFESIILEFKPIQRASCELLFCQQLLSQGIWIGKGIDSCAKENWEFQAFAVVDDLKSWSFSIVSYTTSGSPVFAISTARGWVTSSSADAVSIFRLNQLINQHGLERKRNLVLNTYHGSVAVLVDKANYPDSFFCELHLIPPHLNMDASKLKSFQQLPLNAPLDQKLPAQFYPSNAILRLSVPSDNLDQGALYAMQMRHSLDKSTKESIAKYLHSLDVLAATKAPHFITRIAVSSKKYYRMKVTDNRQDLENRYRAQCNESLYRYGTDRGVPKEYTPDQIVYTLVYEPEDSYYSRGTSLGTELQTVVLEIDH